MAKIIIKWKTQFLGGACKFDVYLMNTYIGELKCGTTLETEAEIGSHMLFFKQKFGLGAKADTSFEVVVNDETETVELKTKFTKNGFTVSYADNAPHILAKRNISECEPAKTESFENGSEKEINKTLTDIKKETKKTNGYLGGCLTVIIIIVIIGFVSSAIFRSKAITDVATSVEQNGKENNQADDADKDNVLYCDDNFKITFVNLVDPKSGVTMYNMNLKLENNSDKNVSIYLSDAYVNDVAITFLGGNAGFEGVAPGKKSICAFMFGYANHGIDNIEDVKKMEFKITLRNSDEFSDVLLSTDTITLNLN